MPLFELVGAGGGWLVRNALVHAEAGDVPRAVTLCRAAHPQVAEAKDLGDRLARGDPAALEALRVFVRTLPIGAPVTRRLLALPAPPKER